MTWVHMEYSFSTSQPRVKHMDLNGRTSIEKDREEQKIEVK